METKSLYFENTIKSWDEAVALGNGDMGCLIWNTSDKLRLSLDKGGIWDCSDPPENQENFTYENLKELVKKKKKRAIAEKYDDCYNMTTPTKLPAGKIIIDLGVKENVSSRLDFITAEAEITAGSIKLNSFINALSCYGLIKINSSNIKYEVQNPKYGKERKDGKKECHKGITQGLSGLHYKDAEFIKQTENGIDYQYFIQQTTDSFYGIFSGMIKTDGNTLIAYTVMNGKTDSFRAEGREIIKNALASGYEKAFFLHKKYWADFWEKSSISLPDKEMEKLWYLNTYLLGSGSRKNCFPMPLQGVWTADNNELPPWKGDYHHDLNTQMTYTSYLTANRIPEGECFIDYLLSMSEAGEKFSENFYGVKGLCLPSVMDIEGHALGGWPQYALSPTNQLWLCSIMARHYYFTKDKNYLEKIYDYCSKTGTFLMNILKEENGFYKLPLSSSPEINDNSFSAWLKPNSNYDLALMRCFMSDMTDLSKATGRTEEKRLWEERLSKLEPLSVGKNNVLNICEGMSLKESHRHFSHCMSIYPLRTLIYEGERNREIIDATIKNLEDLGMEYWTGYTVGWMAQLYIISGQAEKALHMLQIFFRYNCTINGFHINGDPQDKLPFKFKYRPFTLEGNFLACDALQNMLLMSGKEGIKVFPAVPENWKDLSFSSFRAYGNLLISADMKEGLLSYLEIRALSDCTFKLYNDISHMKASGEISSTEKITIKKGEKLTFTV